MIFRSVIRLIGFAGLVITTISANAHEYQQNGIVIDHPWARPTPPVQPINAAAYLTIENRTDQRIRLTGVSTPVTDHASVHQSREEEGMMRMAPVKDGLDVPPNASVSLQPMSYHLMLMDLAEPLKQGDSFPLTLTFEGGQTLEVQIHVQTGP
jgi:hypothetical protein